MKNFNEQLTSFLISFCETSGCDLLLRDRKGSNVFEFRCKGEELSHQGKVTSGSFSVSYKTGRADLIPQIEFILSMVMEKYAAEEEKTRQGKIIYSLQKAADAMSSIYDMKSVLQLILNTATEISGADTGAILLVEEKNMLEIEVASGKDQDLVHKVKLEIGQGITGWVAKHGQLLNVADVKKDSRFYEPLEEVRSELAVPMFSGEEIIGVLNVDCRRVNAFGRQQEMILQSLAAHAAKIIENSRLYKKASQKVSELSVLFQITKAVSTVLDLNELLNKIVEMISRVMMVEKVSLLLFNKETGMLEICAAIGLEEQFIRETRIAPGESISGHVLKTGEPLLINDLKHDERFGKFYRREIGSRSMLSIPLILRNEVIGVINVNNKKNRDVFSSDDCNLLETVAGQIAAAISNARLYEKATEKLRELSMINTLGNRFSSSLNLEKVLQLFIGEVQRIFNADRASLMLLDHDCRKLKIREVYGLNDREKAITLDSGEGIAGLCVKMKKPILVRSTLKSDNYKRFYPDGRDYSLISAPLVFKNRVLGVINLERLLTGHGNYFTQENLELLMTISYQGANAIENANLYSELINLYLTTIQSLASAVDAKDPYTHGHSQRVADYAVSMAEAIGCSPEELQVIRHTALLHDIGKIGVSERILMKPGKLTDEEYEEIKRHPVLGTEIIKSIKFLGEVSLYLKHHHERFDGKGYPDGLKSDQIPLGSRIISIADTFDAMTSDRPYRKGCSMLDAVSELERCSGNQFDPQLVEMFAALIRSGNMKHSDFQLLRKSGS